MNIAAVVLFIISFVLGAAREMAGYQIASAMSTSLKVILYCILPICSTFCLSFRISLRDPDRWGNTAFFLIVCFAISAFFSKGEFPSEKFLLDTSVLTQFVMAGAMLAIYLLKKGPFKIAPQDEPQGDT